MSTDSVLDDILAAAELMSVSDGAPATSPGVVSTPVSRVSPRTGGGRGSEGTVPVKMFSVLDIDCSDRTYCFGVISNASAFCIKRNCTVKSHAGVKMSFAGSDLSFMFIRRNIPGSVFSEPKLLTSKVPDDVMVEWESKTFSAYDWSMEFQAIDGSSEPLTSAEEIQNETDFLAESSLMRTPAKTKKDSFAGEEFEAYALPAWKNRKYVRSFPERPEELEALIDAGVKKGVLSTTVSKIESYIEAMGDALADATDIHHDRLVSLENSCEVLIGSIQTLKSRMGSAVDIGERFTAPTFWGSTAFIAYDLSKVTQDVDTIKEDVVIPMKESMVALEAADVELLQKNEKVVKVVKLLLSRVQGLTDSMAEVKSDLVLVRTEQGARFATQDIGPVDAADDLMDFIMSEEKAPVTPDRRSSGSVSGGSHAKTLSDEEDDVGSFKSVLSKLIEDVRLLQSSKQTASIRFAGLGFTDLSECSA